MKLKSLHQVASPSWSRYGSPYTIIIKPSHPDLAHGCVMLNSWPIIRALFEDSARHGLMLAAMDNGRPVGLASAAVYDSAEVPTYADTWQTGDQIAEIAFLVVPMMRAAVALVRP